MKFVRLWLSVLNWQSSLNNRNDLKSAEVLQRLVASTPIKSILGFSNSKHL